MYGKTMTDEDGTQQMNLHGRLQIYKLPLQPQKLLYLSQRLKLLKLLDGHKKYYEENLLKSRGITIRAATTTFVSNNNTYYQSKNNATVNGGQSGIMAHRRQQNEIWMKSGKWWCGCHRDRPRLPRYQLGRNILPW